MSAQKCQRCARGWPGTHECLECGTRLCPACRWERHTCRAELLASWEAAWSAEFPGEVWPGHAEAAKRIRAKLLGGAT